MAAAAAVTVATGIINCSPSRRLKPCRGQRKINLTRLSFQSSPVVTDLPSTSWSVLVRASEPEKSNGETDRDGVTFQEEDVNYLLKLGAGSFIGAAAIKYGSILVPGITRPNILEALVMISTPVVVAVLLLIRQSRLDQ